MIVTVLRLVFSSTTLVAAALWTGAATAANVSLPGGASSLRESYGDWVVNCTIAGEGDDAHKICAMTQDQKESGSGKRIIAMEVQVSAGASLATLFLPFGLDLASGAIWQIDDGSSGPTLRFRTCLPSGCIVSWSIEPGMIALLRNGTSLKVRAKADDGREMMFPISLAGFGSAFDRTVALSK